MKWLFLLVISIHLAWDANPEPVTGYKIYYGQKSRAYGLPTDAGNVTEYVLEGVDETKPMFFAVTAYDGTQESAFSEEIEVGTGTNRMAGKAARFYLIKVRDGKVEKAEQKYLPTIRY